MHDPLKYIYRIVCFSVFLSFIILFFGVPDSAQAGSYYRYSYGHHGYSYGHYGGYRNYAYGKHARYSRYGYYNYGYPIITRRHSSYNNGSYYDDRRSYKAPARSGYSSHSSAGAVIDSQQYNDKAWRLLAQGKTDTAFTYFSKAAEAEPSKGNPKIGYALAAADLGQLDKGIWAMRRALNVDPDALHYVTLNDKLDSKVRRMIDDYVKQQEYSGKQASSSFMLASLHYLRRDMASARSYINQAVRAGHVSSSTKSLQKLIANEEKG